MTIDPTTGLAVKYAILNPVKGEYVFVNTEDEIEDKKREIAMEFYLLHTHNSPVTKVIINQDNSEVWETY